MSQQLTPMACQCGAGRTLTYFRCLGAVIGQRQLGVDTSLSQSLTVSSGDDRH
jgi:hypothetical protein